jgi:hypothetical protein
VVGTSAAYTGHELTESCMPQIQGVPGGHSVHQVATVDDLHTTGESLTADSVRLTVTPSGNVSVTTMYPPNPTPDSEC